MNFENGHLYHIFNRGNNSQKIFFTRENYLFFLKKIRIHILPHADIIAWCLMPNHFHLLVHVNDVLLQVASEGFTQSEALTKQPIKKRTMNDSIGIMLRSYSRAIQKQQKITGSVFQKETKAICLTQHHGISPAWFQSEYGPVINTSQPEKEYPQVCFEYIHDNPEKDNLVGSKTDWEFSSALDYAGIRNGSLINFERVSEYGLGFR